MITMDDGDDNDDDDGDTLDNYVHEQRCLLAIIDYLHCLVSIKHTMIVPIKRVIWLSTQRLGIIKWKHQLLAVSVMNRC